MSDNQPNEFFQDKGRKDKTPSLKDMARTAQGMQQAIVKITSYSKGVKAANAHIKYISRNHKLELEDELGNVIRNKDEQSAVIKDWQQDFGGRKNSRDTVNMVFSAPSKSSPKALLKATRELLHQEFAHNYCYVFTLHNDTNHPHVHVTLKLMGHDGKKLDPRKAYLFELRQKFAQKCREHGIEVEASSRFERGFTNKSRNTAVVQMRKRKAKNIDKDKAYFASLGSKFERNGAKKIINKIANRYLHAAQFFKQKAENETDKKTAHKYKNLSDLFKQHAEKLQTSRSFAEQVLHKYRQHKARENEQCNEFER